MDDASNAYAKPLSWSNPDHHEYNPEHSPKNQR